MMVDWGYLAPSAFRLPLHSGLSLLSALPPSHHFAPLESRRVYWAPPHRDPLGPGDGERGRLQLFYC